MIYFIRILIFLLVLSFWFPEIRIGPKGFVYPQLSIYKIEKIGLPWVFEILIILILISFIFAFFIKKIRLKITHSTVVILWLIYIAVFVIPLSRLLGLEPNEAAFSHMRFTLESLTLFIIVSHMKWKEQDLRIIAWLFIGGAVFNALIAISAFYLPHLILLPINVIQQKDYAQVAGLFSQPSRHSLFLAMGIALIVGLFVNHALANLSILKTIGYFGLIIILSAGVALAQIRTSYMSILMGPLITLWLFGHKFSSRLVRLLLISLIAIIVILALAFLNLLPVAKQRIGSYPFKEEFASTRGIAWSVALRVIQRYPFGTGYDNISKIGERITGQWISHAHNIFLHWGVMFGLQGLILLLYFIIHLYRNLWKFMAHVETPGSNTLFAMQSALTVFLLNGMTEPYFITNSGIWFWLFSGLIVSYCESQLNRKNVIGCKMSA